MTSETIFIIGGTEYDVVKRGIAQAKQFSFISKWLASNGKPIINRVMQENASFTLGTGIEVILEFAGCFSTDVLVDLFCVVFGCEKSVGEEEFDIMVLVDGIIALYNYQPAIKKFVERFLSATPSESIGEVTSTK